MIRTREDKVEEIIEDVAEATEEEDVAEATPDSGTKRRETTLRSLASTARKRVTSSLFVQRRKKRIKSSTKLKRKLQILCSICMRL